MKMVIGGVCILVALILSVVILSGGIHLIMIGGIPVTVVSIMVAFVAMGKGISK